MQEEESAFEVYEPGELEYGKHEEFSYENLITIAFRGCIKSGQEEWIKGYWETKTDKRGNPTNEYKPDSRKVHINSIRTLKNVMIRYFDPLAVTEIRNLEHLDEDTKQKYIKLEQEWYDSLQQQKKSKTYHIKGSLCQDYNFYHDYLDEKLEIYIAIFEHISLLIERTKDFKKEDFGNKATPIKQ